MKSCRAMRPRSPGWRTSRASSSIRIRSAPTISIIRTSCASISIRYRACAWARSAKSRVSSRRRSTTSGSSAGRRRQARAASTSTSGSSASWTFARGSPRGAGVCARGRTPSAGAGHEQVVEGGTPRRLPRLQPEREGPDVAAAYSVRPEARRTRVGAALLGRNRRLRSRISRSGRCPRGSRRSAIGTRTSTSHPAHSKRCWSCRATRARRPGRRAVAAALQETARRARARRRPARASVHPLIEIGRAQEKDAALAGLERWKVRHPDAAAHLAAGRCARRCDAGALPDVDAHPGEPAARPGRSSSAAGTARPGRKPRPGRRMAKGERRRRRGTAGVEGRR